MKNRYFDLIDQTFYFPQDGFDVSPEGVLDFNGIPLEYLIKKYGTPIKLSYLPKIGFQIKKARNLFTRAIRSTGYSGDYHYCYCTKSSHFSHIVEEALRHGVSLETSSAFDLDLILRLYKKGLVDKNLTIICNGFKPDLYKSKIVELLNAGFHNLIPILDNTKEIEYYETHLKGSCKIGIRMATEEEPNFEFYTSRLGIRSSEIVPFFREKVANNPKFKLEMLHFFVDTGIKDTLYYWGELNKALKVYGQIKSESKDLSSINIGGGMPIRNSLGFEFDYKYMIKEIVRNIARACEEDGVPEPDIYTEFGKYTVGESGAVIFSVLQQKRQNDSELWYIIDNSLMNTLPDTWGIGERFILLPINKWYNEYHRVNIGGLSCDNSDYYNSEIHESQVFLPAYSEDDETPLYLGFFHTGAYQDSISGYGGLQHCLIPAPKHILIYKDEKGNLVDEVYQEEQGANTMLKLLGY